MLPKALRLKPHPVLDTPVLQYSFTVKQAERKNRDPAQTTGLSRMKYRDSMSLRRDKAVSRAVGRAIHQYEMISDGDRIAVALSGGKDSLTLMWALQERLSRIPINYSLLAIYIVNICILMIHLHDYPKSYLILRQLET